MKSLHQSFVSRIHDTHPNDAEDLLAAIDREPWISVRTNPCKPSNSIALPWGETVEWCHDGRYLTMRPQFTLMPQFHAGAFYVQEASSMFLSHALQTADQFLPTHPTCLDLCAAPGGKTTLLLSRMADRGIVVANEVVRSRAWILRENVAKWGLPGAIVTNRTPEEIAKSGARFDLITVDAPCSGEGMFRKDDVAVSEWSPKLADDCAARSRRILSEIWPALRPGGVLIYSTCTFNPDENELCMQWATEELGAENISIQLEDKWGIETLSFCNGEGYAFYPHKVKGEGLFMCILRKSESDNQGAPHQGKSKDKRSNVTSFKEFAEVRKWVTGLKSYQTGTDVVAFPSDRATEMIALCQQLSPIMSGTPICSILAKKGLTQLSPAPELAFSTAFNPESFPKIEADKDNALKFLHGDSDIIGVEPNTKDGWILICHDNLGLGFVKKIGNRINNYYPKEWRIKMSVQ